MRPLSPICILLLALAVPGYGATISVSGRVLDSQASSLPNMVVAAYDELGRLTSTGTTDSIGMYGLSVKPGQYRFLAYDPQGRYATEFAGASDSFETSPLIVVNTALKLDFTLRQAEFIGGFVRSVAGTPRPGLTVAAYYPSGTRRGFTTTDSNGFYFLALPPGAFKVATYDNSGQWATMFHPAARAFSEAPLVSTATAALRGNTDIVVDRAAKLTGTTVAADSGVPLPSILVYAFTPAGAQVSGTATDQSGAFRLSVPPGPTRLVAADPSKVFANAFQGGGSAFDQAPILTLAPAEQRAGMVLSMVRGAGVAGRVVNASGVALAGIVAGAYNPDGTLQTSSISDPDGRYSLVVQPGEVIAGASDSNKVYATEFFAGSPTFKSANRLRVSSGESQGAIDFSLEEGGRFTGMIRGASGQPVAGVTAGAYDAAEVLVSSSTSGTDGRYTIVVPAGEYRLAAYDPLYRYAVTYAGNAASFETSVPLTVAAATEVTSDFTVISGIPVRGTVATRDGSPLAGVEVTALDPAGNQAGATVSVDGAFTLLLPAGTYRFMAEGGLERKYQRSYYLNATRLEEALEVALSEGQVPPSLHFGLDPIVRRRGARH